MLRARLGLGAAFVGFAIIVTELDFALHNAVLFHEWESHTPGSRVLPYDPLSERVIFYFPAALLALASLVGGLSLCRALRGRARWTGYACALAPVAALLALYKPPVSYAQLPLHVNQAVLPWAFGYWTSASGNSTLALCLQVAVYLAAAAYVSAIVLGLPRWQRPRQAVVSVLPPGSQGGRGQL